MSSELNPCPFCGQPGGQWGVHTLTWHTRYGCKPCNVDFGSAEEWNRRPSAAAAPVAQGEVPSDAKDARCAVAMLNYSFELNILAMQAAYIEWTRSGAEEAMKWIGNTLDGPGLIPDADEPPSAQAYFGRERKLIQERFDAARAALSTPSPAVPTSDAIAGTLNGVPFDQFEAPARALHEAMCKGNLIRSAGGWSFDGWTADGRAVKHKIGITGYERTGPTVEKERIARAQDKESGK